MQVTTHILAFLVLVVASVLAAPASIERRAANLEISLRETKKDTVDWHFALVIHAPDSIPAKGTKKVNLHEHVINTNTGCLEYDHDSKPRHTGKGHLSVTGTLLAAKGESNDAALEAAVVQIIQEVHGTETDTEPGSAAGFNNCFDFAVEAVRRLNTARYVSQADSQKFRDYHDAHAASVHAKTDARTIALCNRANGKSCRSAGKTPSKALAPAKKILSKASAPAKKASKTGKK